MKPERVVLAEPPRVKVPKIEVPELLDANELLRTEFPTEPSIINGGLVYRQTLSVVGGEPKVGKSNLMLNVAIRRACGMPWLGFQTMPGRTLYIQAEIPARLLKSRLALLMREAEVTLPPGQLMTVSTRQLRLSEVAGRTKLRKWLEATGADWCIIDPLARFYAGEENSSKEMGMLIDGLAAISEDLDVAFTLVHHTAKPRDDRRGGQRLRGSSALFGAADAVLILSHTPKTRDQFHLGFELRHAEEPPPMTLGRTPGLWYHSLDPTEASEGADTARARLQEVIEDIRSQPAGAASWGQLLARQKERAPTVKDSTLATRLSRTLKLGRKEGLLSKDGDLGWALGRSGE